MPWLFRHKRQTFYFVNLKNRFFVTGWNWVENLLFYSFRCCFEKRCTSVIENDVGLENWKKRTSKCHRCSKNEGWGCAETKKKNIMVEKKVLLKGCWIFVNVEPFFYIIRHKSFHYSATPFYFPFPLGQTSWSFEYPSTV